MLHSANIFNCLKYFFSSFPCFQNPYPMDFHKSPVTYCAYFADCPNDLIPAFYSVGAMGTKQCGCSDKVLTVIVAIVQKN